MPTPTRILILLGLVLIAAGLVFWAADRGLPLFKYVKNLGHLPGDIRVQKENFSFFFPLTTCIVVSVLLTLIFRLFGR